MEYMLVFRETLADFERRNQSDSGNHTGAWMAYIGAMAGAGIMTSGNGLQPPQTAAIVTMRDGKRQVQDGPYADLREHLGGYVILKVETLDEALGWAARAPCAASGSVEVRPVYVPGQSAM